MRPATTAAIADAALAELVEHGYARLSMDRVARRAGVGKSALYRRWPSKEDMVVDVVAHLPVPVRPTDAGAGAGASDVALAVGQILRAAADGMADRHLGGLLPDLLSEMVRTPRLAAAVADHLGRPVREWAAAAVVGLQQLGAIRDDVDLDLLLDLLAGPIYWRLTTRSGAVTTPVLDQLTDLVVRAVAADPRPSVREGRAGGAAAPADAATATPLPPVLEHRPVFARGRIIRTAAGALRVWTDPPRSGRG